MSRHHRRRTITSIAAAAGIVIAGTAWGLGAGAEPAVAKGTDAPSCSASQLTATMVRETGNPGLRATRSYGAIQLTAKRGQTCTVVGAPGALLYGTTVDSASDDSAPRTVRVSPTTPAWIPVDWPDEASPSAQQTPRVISLGFGKTDLPVRWTGGGVDAVGAAGPVYVRGVQPGTAPFHHRS